MNDIRKLMESVELIEEGYFSRLSVDLDELYRSNPNTPDENLIAFVRRKHGDKAADFFRSQIESGEYEQSLEEGYGEETFDEMVDYWKQSLSSSIVSKGVFTQLYDAANNNIDELNSAIADQAYSIAETYHGSGEGIGSSDQNHFIMHIGQSLGIDDLFGWNKPKDSHPKDANWPHASDEEMDRDKANRGSRFKNIGEGASKKIGCTECDEVSTETAWEKNDGSCPKCNNSTQGVAEDINESLHFFVDPQARGAIVMSSNGDIHDYYDDAAEARQVAAQLNAEYNAVEEGQNANKTEHSGAKKGKGAFYGQKKTAKNDSNKKRRENDKKAIVDEDINRMRQLAGLNEVKSGNFNSKMIGKRVKIVSQEDSFGKNHFGEEGVIHRASREHTFSQMVPFIIEYGVELDSGEKITIRRESVRKIKQVKETASGGATGAGAIASSPAAMNGMQSRNPSIYGQTKLRKKPEAKKRPTREEAGDGIGRDKKK